ncbi:MAG: serine/threonine protein kinase [Planctomycetes bacterium]|nr:serine/threonine protein kinase [Planctomycetota bacterium]
MAAPDPTPDRTADRERIVDLVAEAMDVLEQDGEPGLERFCAGLGADREPVLARLKTLRSVGLMQSPAAASPEVPDQVGDFRLLERIGAGGMGVVHRARHLSLDHDAAVKLIRPDQLVFPGVRERFRREVAIVARLQHEGIVRLYSFGEDRGVPWFAMERIDGVSLADVLQRCRGKAPRDLVGSDFARAVGAVDADGELFAGRWLDVCLRVLEKAALAVAAAHAAGVLHRDLKPSNVMVTPAGRVVLLDFGLAWSNVADRLTRSGAPLGTVNYMAPEQLAGAGASLDERVDVYALGVVLRELLTLQPAFAGTTFDTVAERVRAGLPTAFDARSAASRDAAVVCTMAMDRDRDRRHPTALTLARDLRNVLEHRPILATPPSLALRLRRFAERHRAVTAAVAVAVVGLLAAPAVIAWRERSLRLQLEQEVGRADTNLGLAAEAMTRTLERFDTERIAWVPDLKPLADGVLVDTDAFLDALLNSNPADPAARLRLATTLRRAGHVRWQFFDLPRTAKVFHRVLELLDGAAGDAETVDEIYADVRLALVYVERTEAEPAARVYDELLARLAARGPIVARSPSVQAHAARAAVRAASLALRRDPNRAAAMLAEARTIRANLDAAMPSIDNSVEIARCALVAIELATRSHDDADRARRYDEAAAASARALALTPSSRQDREILAGWLVSWNSRLTTDGRHAEALAATRSLVELWDWFRQHEPSRAQHFADWASAHGHMSRALVGLGRIDEAVAGLRACVDQLESAIHVWPQNTWLHHSIVVHRTQIAELVQRQGDAALHRAAVEEVRVATHRALAATARSAPMLNACTKALVMLARDALQHGDLAGAAATIEEAVTTRAAAVQEGARTKVLVGTDVDLRLLQAEILLQSERSDDAFAVLEAMRPLPRDLEQQVPTLGRHTTNARAQALFARARDGR